MVTRSEGIGYGVSAFSAGSSFLVSSIQFGMEEDARKHARAMSKISTRISLNALSDKQVAIRDASIRAAAAIGLASAQDRASAEVSAAAAGVAGLSVDGTARGLKQSALRANAARKANTASKLRAVGKERLNVKLASIFGRDMSQNVAPDATSALMGLGMNMLKQYDDNQPEGDKLQDRLKF